MRFWYDTEFLEDGKTIELISIGIVCENEATYYAVNSDAPWDRLRDDDWMMDNVVRHLPTHSTGQVKENKGFGNKRKYSWGGISMRSTEVKPKWVIANEVREFLTGNRNNDGTPVELWADYAAYDHVALAQLWGKMIGLPKGIPMWTHDLRQLWEQEGRPEFPDFDNGEHQALADALELRDRWHWLQRDDDGQTADGGT